jgi:HEPN domain-containing protein
MSRSKDAYEAQRWLDTAANELGAARTLAGSGYHAQACFFSQQCAEKAVKAMWYLIGAEPWGHSVQALIEELPQKEQIDDVGAVMGKAAVLDRYYIPTRYPNGLPDLTPEKTYSAADSKQAIESAGHFLAVAGNWLATWK